MYCENPCPCGYFGDPVKECTCTPAMVTCYPKLISGPVLGRIDIHIELPRLEYERLSDDRLDEPSSAIRPRLPRREPAVWTGILPVV